MKLMDDWGNVYDVPNVPTIGNYVNPRILPVLQQGRGIDITNLNTLNNSANGLMELAELHKTLLMGNGLIASGTGDDKAKQEPTYVVQRPWLEAPEGNVPFDPQTAVALPVAATYTTVVSLVVPDGYDGVINAYSWNFTGGGFTQGSGDIVVQVWRDGVPIRNYDNITVEKGTIAQPRNISPLRIYSKQVITLAVSHVANGLLNGNVVGSFVGYFYPSAS